MKSLVRYTKEFKLHFTGKPQNFDADIPAWFYSWKKLERLDTGVYADADMYPLLSSTADD